MKFAVLIDYDNLDTAQKGLGIYNIVTKALILTPMKPSEVRGTCDVRVYGGWYEGVDMTTRAQDVTVAVQREFPSIIRLPGVNGQNTGLAANAELAFGLLEEPAHHLFNTYRKKGKPANVRIQSPNTVGCLDVSCPLISARKLFKTGRCPTLTCASTVDDLVYRHEQKLVDTMLTCDLIYSAHLGYDCVVLISDDDDFLPPIRTALLRGTPIVRFHPKANWQPASFPAGGARFFEMEF